MVPISLLITFFHALMPFLSQLFTCMIRHGCVPSAIRNCVLQPLLKPGKDPCKCNSYRLIALAPTLSKVFERCILNIYNSAFFTSPLQFGFKKGYSTTLCSGLIKNVISHYVLGDRGCLVAFWTLVKLLTVLITMLSSRSFLGGTCHLL